MVSDQHIIQQLKIIAPFKFESMICHLLHQGAFLDIVEKNASIIPYGINMEKARTRKSSPRSDAELIIRKLKIESSVQEDWKSKFKEVIKKNKGQPIKKIVFCTNQDTGSMEINVNRKKIDAIEYCRNNLNCEDCFVINQQSLVLALQTPEFFHIRRNFLNIPEDFFCSVEGYKDILKNSSSLACNVSKSKIESYVNILTDKLIFDPKQIILLHNNEYFALLHAIAVWALGQNKKDSTNTLSQSLCFIKWPYSRASLKNISDLEIKSNIPTIVFIWGAHEIKEPSDYLKFNKLNVMLVFICKSAFKDKVVEKLRKSGSLISIKDLYISGIGEEEVSSKECVTHERKIYTLVSSLKEQLKKCEALIYFYSPFYLDDPKLINKIRSILKINKTQLNQLFKLLVQSNLASRTGNILWLKQPIIARKLLNDYIDDGTLHIEEMII